MIRTDVSEVWQEYQKGLHYCESIHLFETVQRNEDFYVGDQWKGVNAPDLDKPVYNILQRPVSYLIASIMSDDVGVRLAKMPGEGTQNELMEMLSDQLREVMEATRSRTLYRDYLRNACVDGDGCLHYWFESKEPKQLADGSIRTDGEIRGQLVENTDVYFGNTESSVVEEQPWIILRERRGLEELREWAEENGIEDAGLIQADKETGVTNSEHEGDKVTVLRKYWKQGGTVWELEQTQEVVLTKPKDTGLQRYPLVWMPWERIKNRYHGQAVLTGMIPNQIYRNKMAAMAHRFMQLMGFQKIAYDRTKLPGGWTNRVGEAVPVNGDPKQAISAPLAQPSMSPQVMELLSFNKSETVEAVGASDAALGNIKPDNATAIIATQKATAVPLERHRMAFYDAVEECCRIWLDMMAVYYQKRIVRMKDPALELLPGMPDERPMGHFEFDFSTLRDMQLKINIDVGAASYWSELTQATTLSNLFTAKIIDGETYLEHLPEGVLSNKQSILDAMRKKQAQQAAMLPEVPV